MLIIRARKFMHLKVAIYAHKYAHKMCQICAKSARNMHIKRVKYAQIAREICT